MQEFVNSIVENLKYIESTSPLFFSVLLGMSIIILESMIPILPLAVFIALNMLLFGNIIGFIMSWIATCIGCIISFYIIRKGIKSPFEDEESEKIIKKMMKKFNKLSLPDLVIIIAMPFIPAFAMNIAAGLSKIDSKKYIMALFIAKLVIVYFWGFVGTTFLQSITDISVILKLIILLSLVYILSKLLMKKFKID